MTWWGQWSTITSEINHRRYPFPADCDSHLAAKHLICKATYVVFTSYDVLQH